jgi:hypothetical protein
MFCSKCGKENEDYANKCSACGFTLKTVAGPVSGKPWPDGVIYLLLVLSGILPFIGIIAGSFMCQRLWRYTLIRWGGRAG